MATVSVLDVDIAPRQVRHSRLATINRAAIPRSTQPPLEVPVVLSKLRLGRAGTFRRTKKDGPTEVEVPLGYSSACVCGRGLPHAAQEVLVPAFLRWQLLQINLHRHNPSSPRRTPISVPIRKHHVSGWIELFRISGASGKPERVALFSVVCSETGTVFEKKGTLARRFYTGVFTRIRAFRLSCPARIMSGKGR